MQGVKNNQSLPGYPAKIRCFAPARGPHDGAYNKIVFASEPLPIAYVRCTQPHKPTGDFTMATSPRHGEREPSDLAQETRKAGEQAAQTARAVGDAAERT